MTEAVGGRALDAGSGGGRLQSPFRMRDRAKGVNKLGVGRHHAKPAALSVPDRDGRLGAGELQIAPLQVKGFGLAKRGAPEQQGEEPRLSGRHGV